MIFYIPYLSGEDEPILTNIFFNQPNHQPMNIVTQPWLYQPTLYGLFFNLPGLGKKPTNQISELLSAPGVTI